ncbi:CapA family protein [Nocardioides oleivorans]|nr:CapA family protein [Nocardioides oleivorans]
MTGAGTTGARRRLLAAALGSTCVALAACTTPSDVAPGPTPGNRSSTTPGSSSSDPTPDPTPSPDPAPAAPIRIALAGDIHFEGVLAGRLRDPSSALAPAAEALSAADLTIANLETSVGAGGRPEPGKRYTFSAGPEAFAALAAAGVDVVSMANNHALDFGRGRLPSTLAAARRAGRAAAPLAVVGIGRDADRAFAPALTDVGGTVVATLAASVADQDPTADPTGDWAATDNRAGIADALDPARLLAGVRRAREDADVVVVYLHWGVQGERCPSQDQRTLARRLVGAGADVVAGSHAHRLQGDGRLGDAYVAYGLGNFAWYSPGGSTTSRTGILYLTVRPRTGGSRPPHVVRAAWEPRRIGVDGLPATTGPKDGADFRADRESLRSCAGLG